jgi:hypothetical protein
MVKSLDENLLSELGLTMDEAIEKLSDLKLLDISHICQIIINQKDIDPEVADIIDRRFWDMI